MFLMLLYRTIIQVLISGRGQSEVVTVHSDSSGKTLYKAILERSRVVVPLVHGVNIIRHSVSLQEQGIHHLSTVFVLPVMGEGGGRTQLGKHSKLGNTGKRQG